MKNQIEKYIKEKLEAKGKELDVTAWLDSAAQRAAQITVATHVLKYSNSDARGTNIRVEKTCIAQEEEAYITTSSLDEIIQDVVGNAAALDVAGLLQLEHNGVSLLDMIAGDDSSPFEGFTDSKERILCWMKGFKEVLNLSAPCSHSLAKQVYFPISGGGYHLLEPLYATSLSQEIYDKVKQAKFSEEAKSARDLKRKGMYSDQVIYDFPGIAIQTFGGTKPQNISKLNSLRRGQSCLLRSMPPIWEKVRTPPKNSVAFWRELERKMFRNIQELKQFLTSFQKRKNIFEERQESAQRIEQFIDCVISLIQEFQAFEPGWSLETKLGESEKIWLDPEENGHKALLDQDDWKKDISKQFSRWLTHKLNYKKEKDYILSDPEIQEIEKEFYKTLKEVV